MRRLSFLFPLLVCSALYGGDWFTVGFRAGIPLTDAFQSARSGSISLKSTTRNFTIGPSAELLLPFGLGIEVEALYKRTTVAVQDAAQQGEGAGAGTTGSWEFPLLAKLRLPGAGLRPYVAAGAAFRRFGELAQFATGPDRSTSGFVIGGGLELKIGRLRVAPELRYTRWKPAATGGADLLRYSRNQADFLVGITF